MAHYILFFRTGSVPAVSPSSSSPYDPYEYMTFPQESPQDDEFLTTPTLGMDLNISPSIYSSPLFDFPGDFTDDMTAFLTETNFFGGIDSDSASLNAPPISEVLDYLCGELNANVSVPTIQFTGIPRSRLFYSSSSVYTVPYPFGSSGPYSRAMRMSVYQHEAAHLNFETTPPMPPPGTPASPAIGPSDSSLLSPILPERPQSLDRA